MSSRDSRYCRTNGGSSQFDRRNDGCCWSTRGTRRDGGHTSRTRRHRYWSTIGTGTRCYRSRKTIGGDRRCRSRGGSSLCGASRRHRTHNTGSSCGASRRSSSRGRGSYSYCSRSGSGGGRRSRRGSTWSKQAGGHAGTHTRTTWTGCCSLTNGSWRCSFFYHSFCESDIGSHFSGTYSRSSSCSDRYEGSYSSLITVLLCIANALRAGGGARRNQTGTVSSLSNGPTTGIRTRCSRTWSTRRPLASYRSSRRTRRLSSSGSHSSRGGGASSRNKSGKRNATTVVTTANKYCGITCRNRRTPSWICWRSRREQDLPRPWKPTAVKRKKARLERGESSTFFINNSSAKHI